MAHRFYGARGLPGREIPDNPLPGECRGAVPRSADYFAEVTNMLVERRQGIRDQPGVMIGD
ncbi:MAG: hypothetical protein WAN02_00250 [Mycobacterium sp.]